MIFTTSWDDGHKADLKLARLLTRYGAKGTFYIPKICPLRSLIDQEIVWISKIHEIGAHDLDNDHLTRLNPEQIREQVRGAKDYLENLLSCQIKMYSYPRGEYNQAVKKIVQDAGFVGARTVKEFEFEAPDDDFEMATTLHIYPFPFRKRDAKHYHLTRFLFQPLSRKFSKMIKLGLPFNSFLSWIDLAKNLFDYTLTRDGVFHLWGHSWELDRYEMWNDLEEFLKYIASQPKVEHLTNSELLR